MVHGARTKRVDSLGAAEKAAAAVPTVAATEELERAAETRAA
jgi:hypothetical protein